MDPNNINLLHTLFNDIEDEKTYANYDIGLDLINYV